MNHESSMINRIEALPEARKNTILTAIWLKTLTGTCGAVYTTDIETLVKASEQVETEVSKAARREYEHKLPDLPSWAPPLPEGYVPLGFGGEFKTNGPFAGGCSIRMRPQWDEGLHWWGFGGEYSFYAAPRDSEIVRLNFPWLAEEANATGGEADSKDENDRTTSLVVALRKRRAETGEGLRSALAYVKSTRKDPFPDPEDAKETEKREDPYEQEQRDDEADNTPKSDRDTVLVEGIGTMLRIQAASCACERRSDHNLTLAYQKAAYGPAYKEAK